MKIDFVPLFFVTSFSSIFSSSTSVSAAAFPEIFSSVEPGNEKRQSQSVQHPPELFARKVAHYFPAPGLRKQMEIPPDSFDSNAVDISDNSDDDGGGGHSHKGIGGKIAGGVIGIVAISLLGVFLIPLLLLPLAVVVLIGYNFPLVILIDIPNMDQNNNDQNQLGRATSFRSILESGSCIERISCRIGRRSGTSFKIIMHWISRQSESKLMQRISRGFEDDNDCASYTCGVPILRRLF